ncbi:MAG: hypothetical protein Q9172_003931 [Xanthocarpia lactea]
MAKNARTHDISMIDYHVTDVETLAKVLNNAVTAACPKASTTRYRGVYVLLLCWADDDLGVETELDGLDAVFQTVYHYKTDQWKIPSSFSHNALVFRIMQVLQDFESKDELLIMYYGGHGYMNDDRQCVWLCIQTMLEEAESDVLVLLDCCAAASSGGSAGKRVTEVIAACGFEAPAPGVGHHSFTSNLTDELRYLGRSKTSFTTAFLHNKVLARLKQSWNPRYINGEHRERRRTPIYIHLADGARQRCIELGPYLAPPSIPPHPQSGSSEQSSVSSIPSASLEDVDVLGLHQVSQGSLSGGSEFGLPQVLISVALEDEQMLHTSDWVEWLKSFPAVAKSVHIQGVYKSNSTLLHLSLPVALWDVIPSNPAISFISFIKTHNLARNRRLIHQPSTCYSSESSAIGHPLPADNSLKDTAFKFLPFAPMQGLFGPRQGHLPYPVASSPCYSNAEDATGLLDSAEGFKCTFCPGLGKRAFKTPKDLEEHWRKVHSMETKEARPKREP